MLKSKILNSLKQYPMIKLCLLFGSAAKGPLRFDSDIDIAVAADRTLSSQEKLSLIEDLAIQLKRGVDLIDMQQVSGYILQQALSTGKIICNKDKNLYAFLIKKMWYNQADMMPYYDMILRKRRERFLNG